MNKLNDVEHAHNENQVTPKDYLIFACSMVMSNINKNTSPSKEEITELYNKWRLLTREDKIAIAKTMRRTSFRDTVIAIYTNIIANIEQGYLDNPISSNLWVKDFLRHLNPSQMKGVIDGI